jgi:hypothetical protein
VSVRVTLAVLVGVLLLATVAPAVEDAQHARREAALDRAAATVDERATALVAGGAPPPRGVPGSRRTVTLSLPDETVLVFTNRTTVLRGRIDGRRSVLRALPVPVHLSTRTHRVTHRTRLVLAYESRGDHAVLVVTRGFIRERAAKNGHADTPRTALPGGRVDR